MIALQGLGYGWSWKLALAFIIVVLTNLVGDLSAPVMAALATLVIVDWITGVVSSIKKGRSVSSRRSYEGVIKIFIYLAICIMAHQTAVKVNPLLLGWIDDMVYIYIAITEGISILENCQCFGNDHGINLPFIGKLIKLLRSTEETIESCKEEKPVVETI